MADDHRRFEIVDEMAPVSEKVFTLAEELLLRKQAAKDYRPLLPQLQRDLIDQLQRELAHERSCKLALLATIEDLQALVRAPTRERVS